MVITDSKKKRSWATMSQDHRSETDGELKSPSKLLNCPEPRVGGNDNPLIRNIGASSGGVGDDFETEFRALTPNTKRKVESISAHKPSYSFLETARERNYNLDYPSDAQLLESLQLDPTSRFYARKNKRTIDLKTLLPYKTEEPNEYSKFLSHIVTHLYLAIKALDLQGFLSISAKDLAAVRQQAGISDVDMVLQTNLFELPETKQATAQDPSDSDSEDYFIPNEIDESESEYEDDSDDEEYAEPVSQEENIADTVVDDDDDHAAGQHKKSPKSAAIVGVRIWTQELLTWLKAKYDMPLSLRIALIKVYFAICTSRGQSLNLKFYVKAFETLTKDIPSLKSQGIVLPWRQLYQNIHLQMPQIDGLNEFEDPKLLIKLAQRASFLFSVEDLPEIYSTIACYFKPSQGNWVGGAFTLLPINFAKGGRDNKYDIRHYLPSYFYMWTKVYGVSGGSSHISARLGTVAMQAMHELNDNPSSREYIELGDWGVFTEVEMNFMFTYALNGLLINENKYGSHVVKYFQGVMCAIAYSITPNKSTDNKIHPIINSIRSLLNAIESYVQPTNSGPWAVRISEMIYALVYQVHKRFNQEREVNGALYNIPNEMKLDDETINQFIEVILPIAKIGLHSKYPQASHHYINALYALARMNAEAVLESTLLDIYDSLDSVISNHRIFLALRLVTKLARFFASTPVYRAHLTRIMLLAVPGIDSNDLVKTGFAIELLTTIASFVPFCDLTEGTGDISVAMLYTELHLESLKTNLYLKASSKPGVKFETDEESELDALKSSSVAFPDIMERVLERFFILLENMPDMSKATGVDKELIDVLPGLFYVIAEASSDAIFKSMRKQIFNFIFENNIHNVAEFVAPLCGAMIKRDPSYFKVVCPQIMEKIRESLADGAGRTRSGLEIVPRDQPFVWYMSILNNMTGNANGHVLDCGKELTEFSLDLMGNVRGTCCYYSSHLVNQILQALTKIKLAESRLIAPAYVKRNGISAACWGGFQFDEYRFSKENLNFEWFVPEEKHVSFAIDVLNLHVKAALRVLTEIISSHTNTAKRAESGKSFQVEDDIRVYLIYLGYCISGISYLFDPSFEEDIPSLTAHDSQSLQKRLLLLQEIRKMQGHLSLEDLQVADLLSHLLRIVTNLDEFEISDVVNLENKNGKDAASSDTINSTSYTTEKPNEAVIQPFPSIPQLTLESAVDDLKDASPISESARGTPVNGEFDTFNVNPGMTFRQRKLYTCNYFFGEDLETRRANSQYIRLHNIRYLVGRSMHLICKFLVANFMDNNALMSNYLHVVRTWFNDVGCERMFSTSHSKLSFSHMKNIFAVNRVRKPFTRLGFASRIEAYHLFRVSLHATSRTLTNLDRILLEDVLKLSTSTYSRVSLRATDAILDIMKRTSGSYSIVVKSLLRYLSRAIEEKDAKKITSILRVFKMKRLNTRIQNDFLNVEKFVVLLHKSLSVDDVELSDRVDGLLNSVGENITPPSEVCIIDLTAIDAIRPPDTIIDLEIRAVSIAKENKRKLFLAKLTQLENKVVSLAKSMKHWRTLSSYLNLLINSQLVFEMNLNSSVMSLFAEESSSEYPLISKSCLNGILIAVYRIQTKQSFGSEIRKIIDYESLRREYSIVNTEEVDGQLYSKAFREEIDSPTPSYFVDADAEKGWLLWGKTMTVAHSVRSYPSELDQHDVEILKILNQYINKRWLINIIKLRIADNESAGSFNTTDIFAFAAIIFLISQDILKSLTFEEVLEVIDECYVKDENASHITLFQLIAGLLLADSYTKPELLPVRDKFLIRFLTNILEHDLNPGNSGIWCTFAQWLPLKGDYRRFKSVMDVIRKFQIQPDTNYPVRDSLRLAYLSDLVAFGELRSDYNKDILNMCLGNITHEYLDVRTYIGELMSQVIWNYPRESFANSERFLEYVHSSDVCIYENKAPPEAIEAIARAFDQVLEMLPSVEKLTPQEILNSKFIYGAETLLSWIDNTVKYKRFSVGELLVTHVVPLLMCLIGMKEVCQIGNIDPIFSVISLSKLQYSPADLEDILRMLEKYSDSTLNSVQTLILGEFMVVVFFKNLFILSEDQRSRIFVIVNKCLYNDNPMVRDAAAETLSGIIHMSPPDQGAFFISKCSKEYLKKLDVIRKKYRKQAFKNIPAQDMIQLHGATLGLGALIDAYPFVSPPPQWIPEVMTILATKCAGLPGIVGKTAKNTLSNIRKNRQDTWHIDSKVFSSEQMESLEGVLWTSYYI